MRFVIALLALLGVAMAGPLATPVLVAANSGYIVALAQQPGQYSIDINVNDSGAWWTNPLWIGIGVVALVLLIVIVALAARGGGTTVIKE
jgi:hypothetical protein